MGGALALEPDLALEGLVVQADGLINRTARRALRGWRRCSSGVRNLHPVLGLMEKYVT